ncbi:MAG: DUF1674 domain-containing protein [Lysobacterales bacterium]
MNPPHTVTQDQVPALDSNRPPTVSVDQSPTETPAAAEVSPLRPDPTRFGDWEKNGRCIDF